MDSQDCNTDYNRAVTVLQYQLNSKLEMANAQDKLTNADFEAAGSNPQLSTLNEVSHQTAVKLRPTETHKRDTNRKWVVLIASFFAQGMTMGLIYSTSVFYVAFLKAFGKSKAETSVIQGTLTGILLTAGFLNGIITTTIGPRRAGIIGCSIACIGLILSFFAGSIPFLVVTLSILTGYGLSLADMAGVTCVGFYFKGDSKSMALSFISTGAGVGAMTFPYLIGELERYYGWRGCLLLTGGILANMIPCFATFKLPESKKMSYKTETNFNDANVTLLNEQERGSVNVNAQEIYPKEGNKSDQKHNIWRSLTDMRKRSQLLKQFKELCSNKTYVAFTVGLAVQVPTLVSFRIYIFDFLQNSKGFNHKSTLFLFFLMNVGNTVSRLFPGLVKTYIPKISVIAVPCFNSVTGAVVLVLLASAVTYTHHVVLILLMGSVIGGSMSAISVTTMNIVGSKNYSTALGITLGMTGLCNMGAGPISGFMRDITGTYTLVLFVAAGNMILALFIFILTLVLRINRR